MSYRDYSIYVKDILENIAIAENFVANMSFEKFSKDKKTVYAVVRCIEIIGEAAKHVPNSIRKKHPKIPWKRMAGMRDKLVHVYFGIALKVVWKTIKQEIPLIKPLIEEVLADLKHNN